MTRRSVLGAAGIAVLAAGCDRASKPRHAARSTAPAQDDPDVRLAANVLAAVAAHRSAVEATIARFPGTRPGLTPVRTMHATHADALSGAVPKGAEVSVPAHPAPHVPASRAVALRHLRAGEAGLADVLVTAAVQAESGAFARLLASMSVAVDQRLAEWPS